MRRTFNIISVSAAFLLAVATAAAQNLDPTVVVSRSYEGKLLEVHKPAQEMAVPDSIQHFDLDFDYSVFENPYKGSYDFRPYRIQMKPMSSPEEISSFWLKAGAGYTLYPEVDLVWTPFRKGAFKMNVYGKYDAYFGPYRTIEPVIEDDVLSLRKWNTSENSTKTWNGYRMKSEAGIDGTYDWKKNALFFDLAYEGTASKDKGKKRSYDAVDVDLGVTAKPQAGDYFHYGVSASYRYAEDKMKYSLSDAYLSEHDFSFDAVMGPVFARSHKVLFDLGLEMVDYAGALPAAVSQLYIAPHYVFDKGRWHIDAGIRLAKLFRPEETAQYGTKGQFIYPDISFEYALIEDALRFYAEIGGGNRINRYSDILERNPFADPSFAVSGTLLNTTVDHVSLSLGLEGRISKRFTYDIHAGYRNCSGGLFDAVNESDADLYQPLFAYADYQLLNAGVKWNWMTESIKFDGSFEYTYTDGLPENSGVFAPSPLYGDVAFEYNWKRRVFAGADCRFVGPRVSQLDGLKAMIPGFADLGIYGEFALNRKLSFWLRGGNLLNMTIQHTPFYAENGINFTAGIYLNL